MLRQAQHERDLQNKDGCFVQKETGCLKIKDRHPEESLYFFSARFLSAPNTSIGNGKMTVVVRSAAAIWVKV
jgi:hypothetical protein